MRYFSILDMLERVSWGDAHVYASKTRLVVQPQRHVFNHKHRGRCAFGDYEEWLRANIIGLKKMVPWGESFN